MEPTMPLFHFGFSAMASVNELQIWADTETDARRAADTAIADVRRIEAKYSRYRDDSIVTRINREAGNAEVPIDQETAALLHYADQCHLLSEGLFDITSGALRRASSIAVGAKSTPVTPAAPLLFSTITCCPQRLVSSSARMRAMMSVTLPAPNGTTTVTRWFG